MTPSARIPRMGAKSSELQCLDAILRQQGKLNQHSAGFCNSLILSKPSITFSCSLCALDTQKLLSPSPLSQVRCTLCNPFPTAVPPMPLFPLPGALLPQNHPYPSCLGAPSTEQSPAPGTVCAADLGREMRAASSHPQQS